MRWFSRLSISPRAAGSPRRRARAALVLLVPAMALLLTGCLGPRPIIAGVTKQPPAAPDQPYRLQVLVRNDGPGSGQVQVSVRFVDKQTQRVILSNDQEVQLEHEEQSVNFELNLPPTAPPLDQIDVQVDTQYPIE
jgi:ABC-type uncharacterized transport system auxiliary subunit